MNKADRTGRITVESDVDTFSVAISALLPGETFTIEDSTNRIYLCITTPPGARIGIWYVSLDSGCAYCSTSPNEQVLRRTCTLKIHK